MKQLFTAEDAETTAQPSATTTSQLHHKEHEEHEGIFINVFVTLRGTFVMKSGLNE